MSPLPRLVSVMRVRERENVPRPRCLCGRHAMPNACLLETWQHLHSGSRTQENRRHTPLERLASSDWHGSTRLGRSLKSSGDQTAGKQVQSCAPLFIGSVLWEGYITSLRLPFLDYKKGVTTLTLKDCFCSTTQFQGMPLTLCSS